MRKGFIFYKSFYDSIKELDANDQVQIYNAIFNYQFNGEVSELNGVCKSIFTLIIPQLEANNNRYENGCKGGAPKGNQNAVKKQPKNNLETTKKQPDDNQAKTEEQPKEKEKEKDKVKDIIKENIKRKDFTKPTIDEIKNYCNERNNGINAEAFYDFYQSKNWYVGKNKMKDWKACVRTWENRRKVEKNEPEWLNKQIEQQEATEKEQQEVQEWLKEFGG